MVGQTVKPLSYWTLLMTGPNYNNIIISKTYHIASKFHSSRGLKSLVTES